MRSLLISLLEVQLHLHRHNPGAANGFTWSVAATLIAAGIAVTGVVLGLLATSAANRRQRRAEIFAEAIRAVSDYLEGPYRVARCHNSPQQRFALTTDLSAVQGRIDAHAVLIRLHAAHEVATAYDAYVAAARQEAGRQMREQWRRRPAETHADMNMPGQRPFDRTKSDQAKKTLIDAMGRDVRPGDRPWRWFA